MKLFFSSYPLPWRSFYKVPLGMAAIVSLAWQGAGAAEPGKVLHPVALSKDVLAGKGLIDFDPWPKAMQIKPIKSHRSISWFVGETLTSIIYEADDGLLTFTDLPYEEHVRILHGRAILTSVDGHRQIFDPGDDFIVPKGWSGTWQLSGQYREIATFETRSLDAAMQRWFGK